VRLFPQSASVDQCFDLLKTKVAVYVGRANSRNHYLARGNDWQSRGLAYTEVPSPELATFFDEEAFVGH
jgi:hypothetical protein